VVSFGANQTTSTLRRSRLMWAGSGALGDAAAEPLRSFLAYTVLRTKL
jgi:hypothetical protein